MLSKIKQARDRVGALRTALVNPAPEEIAVALPGLEEAAQCLRAVEQEVRAGASAPHEVRRLLKLLKNDLRISARLIEHGMAFCQGWEKMLGAGPEYTQTGHTVPRHSEGTLSLRG
jgi:hypothetical protein